MRNPAEIARMLGWPDAKREPLLRPRVLIRKNRLDGDWQWFVIGPRGLPLDRPRSAPSQPAALALGLAALETASVRTGS